MEEADSQCTLLSVSGTCTFPQKSTKNTIIIPGVLLSLKSYIESAVTRQEQVISVDLKILFYLREKEGK